MVPLGFLRHVRTTSSLLSQLVAGLTFCRPVAHRQLWLSGKKKNPTPVEVGSGSWPFGLPFGSPLKEVNLTCFYSGWGEYLPDILRCLQAKSILSLFERNKPEMLSEGHTCFQISRGSLTPDSRQPPVTGAAGCKSTSDGLATTRGTIATDDSRIRRKGGCPKKATLNKNNAGHAHSHAYACGRCKIQPR